MSKLAEMCLEKYFDEMMKGIKKEQVKYAKEKYGDK